MKYLLMTMFFIFGTIACANNIDLLISRCDEKMNSKREELAERLFEESKIEELIKLSKPCAEKGHPFYQFSLGIIYMNSSMMKVINRKVDYNLAYKWMIKAANQGYEDAILILIDAYSQGDMGIDKDMSKYKYWKGRLEEAREKN